MKTTLALIILSLTFVAVAQSDFNPKKDEIGVVLSFENLISSSDKDSESVKLFEKKLNSLTQTDPALLSRINTSLKNAKADSENKKVRRNIKKVFVKRYKKLGFNVTGFYFKVLVLGDSVALQACTELSENSPICHPLPNRTQENTITYTKRKVVRVDQDGNEVIIEDSISSQSDVEFNSQRDQKQIKAMIGL